MLAAQKDSYSSWIGDYEAENPAAIHLIKVHAPDRIPKTLTASRILYSYRKPEDSVASLLRMKWLEREPTKIRKAYRRHCRLAAYWQPRSHMCASFEDITGEPEVVISRISSTLGLGLSSDLQFGVLDELKALRAPPPGQTYDNLSLLHPAHMEKYAADDLRGADVLRIINELN